MASVKVKETVSFSIQDLNERNIALVFLIRKASGNPPLFVKVDVNYSVSVESSE